MLRERVRSVGISLLGGNSGVEGKYELGIDSIRLVNEEDVDPSGESNHNHEAQNIYRVVNLTRTLIQAQLQWRSNHAHSDLALRKVGI